MISERAFSDEAVAKLGGGPGVTRPMTAAGPGV
jgi:hypothetical protein